MTAGELGKTPRFCRQLKVRDTWDTDVQRFRDVTAATKKVLYFSQ